MSNVVEFPLLNRIRQLWSDGAVEWSFRADRQLRRTGVTIIDLEKMLFDDDAEVLHGERHKGEIRCAVAGRSPDFHLRVSMQLGIGSDAVRVARVETLS